jgi:hypothetical protein
MKTIFMLLSFFLILLLQISCRQQQQPDLQKIIDSLKTGIKQLKPGLGEYMMQIKYHHDELGKSITNKDYERASYETDEIKEVTEKVRQLQITNDKLTQPFLVFYNKYLDAPLNSLADAAKNKDDKSLKINFISLTNNCNSCHHENNMSFMKINQ